MSQAWLRDMAWLEADYEDALRRRAAHHEPDIQEKLLKEPLFCFERAVSISAFETIVTCGMHLISTP